MKRVVVTGIGLVTAIGNNVDQSWQNLLSGVSGVGNITKFETQRFATTIAAEIKNFYHADILSNKDNRRMSLFTQYGVIAGISAIEDSMLLSCLELDKEKIGIITGTSRGAIASIEAQQISTKGHKGISPFFVPGTMHSAINAYLSLRYGFRGVSYNITNGCVSGNQAIGEAMHHIRRGDANVMITGAAESPITPLIISGYNACKALSCQNENPALAAKPWAKNRDGFVMGEGAGILVLEEYTHAIKRNAKIYAELIGYASNSDAYHITSPSFEGTSRCMQLALENAKVCPEQIDYINAHGTSTLLGDRNETNAIKHVFGSHAYKLMITSTKPMTGHLLGAAPAIEAIFTVLSIKNDIIPPTINLSIRDPECDLNYVTNHAQNSSIQYAMNNSFGFGGVNAITLFKKYQ